MKKILIGAVFALATIAHAATKVPVQMLDTTGSTSGQVVVSGGPSGVSSWGSVSVGGLAPIAANTILANATGASASPTAFAMPSCSTLNSALKYASGTGISCGTTFALTTGTLAQFAATTSAQLAGVISDETGSGALVFGTSPTITSPTISGGSVNNAPIGATTASTGAFTTLSASSTVSGAGFSTYLASPPAIGATAASTGRFTTLAATSTITPSTTAGVVGTTAGDNANAGSVGEYLTNTTTGTSVTSGTLTNATTLSLAAGDWDVWGNVVLNPSGGAAMGSWQAGVATTSGGDPGNGFKQVHQPPSTDTNSQVMSAPVRRVNVSATTTVYLIGYATFASGTVSIDGYIYARRRR